MEKTEVIQKLLFTSENDRFPHYFTGENFTFLKYAYYFIKILQYTRITHPAIDIKWERNTYNLDGIK